MLLLGCAFVGRSSQKNRIGNRASSSPLELCCREENKVVLFNIYYQVHLNSLEYPLKIAYFLYTFYCVM